MGNNKQHAELVQNKHLVVFVLERCRWWESRVACGTNEPKPYRRKDGLCWAHNWQQSIKWFSQMHKPHLEAELSMEINLKPTVKQLPLLSMGSFRFPRTNLTPFALLQVLSSVGTGKGRKLLPRFSGNANLRTARLCTPNTPAQKTLHKRNVLCLCKGLIINTETAFQQGQL